MPVDDHVALVRAEDPGAAIAAWRAENPREALDLASAELAEAVLVGADLSGADLRDACLEGADLRGIDLRGADLRGAQLAGAHLEDAVLDGARLDDADLRGARVEGASLIAAVASRARFDHAVLSDVRFGAARVDDARFDHALLTGADLGEVRGLVAHQLRGACVTTTRLPNDVRFATLEQVGDLSRVARALMLATLLTSAYLLLTIGVTRARDVVAQGSELTLPLIGADVPFVAFSFLAPLALFVVYVVLGLTLQALWELVADLPAFFPDGTPLDKRAQPALLGAAIRQHVPLLAAYSWPFSRVQARLADVLVYRVAPLVFVATWWTCLPRQNASLNVFLLALTAAAFGASVVFAQLANGTLSGEIVLRAQRRGARREAGARRAHGAADGSFGDVVGDDEPAPIDVRVDAATPDAARGRAARAPIPGGGHATGAALLAVVVMVLPTVASLSTPDAKALARPDDVGGLDGVLLGMRGAVQPDFVDADLDGADLRTRDFPGLSFDRASMRAARLDDADLRHASLRRVDAVGVELRGAVLSGADLEGADLTGADLRDCDLTSARLARARLAGARLAGADLRGVDLSGVDLSDTVGLTGSQLMAADGWRKARLPRALSLMLGVTDATAVFRPNPPADAVAQPVPSSPDPTPEPETAAPANEIDQYKGDSVGTMTLDDGTVLQVFGPGAGDG